MEKRILSRKDSEGSFGRSFWISLAQDLLTTLAHSVILFTALGFTLYTLDPSRNNSQQKRNSSRLNNKNNKRLNTLQLNEHEAIIALELISPQDITVSFADVGGLKLIKDQLQDLLDLIQHNSVSDQVSAKGNNLLAPPKGILLYGPPGTGKTLLAQAIARESQAAFINLRVSSLVDKYFGESEKLVRAVFSLARKLSPCIIFVDELESLLRKRTDFFEHQTSANIKAEFVSLWDGLYTSEGTPQPKPAQSIFQRIWKKVSWSATDKGEAEMASPSTLVIVVGATNRPWDLDPAVLRRFGRSFEIGLPSLMERIEILQLQMESARSSGLNTEDIRADQLKCFCQNLEGYSGSDIKELCRGAVMIPLRELSKDKSKGLRKLAMRDLEEAKMSVLPTSLAAAKFQNSTTNGFNSNLLFRPQ